MAEPGGLDAHQHLAAPDALARIAPHLDHPAGHLRRDHRLIDRLHDRIRRVGELDLAHLDGRGCELGGMNRRETGEQQAGHRQQ